MKPRIENLEQLRAEIAILKLKKAEDEIYFNQSYQKVKRIVDAPARWFNNALSYIGLNDKESNGKKADWITSLGRVAFPFLLNRTLFRRKGFFMKSIITLLSQKTINSKNFNKDVLSHWVDNLTQWVENTIGKKKENKRVDYGIPPESETY